MMMCWAGPSSLLLSHSMALLDHIRALVEAERGLTDVIERTAPLLPHNLSSTMSSSTHIEPPLLPTPRDIDEVHTILAVARAYAHRTSAPPMWDPSLPVIGFATPNPLPHQLRGGALGAMQLKLAREEKKRRAQQRLLLEEKKERQTILNESESSGGPSLGMQMKDDEEDNDHMRMDVDGGDVTAVVRKRKRENAMNIHDGPNNERVEQQLSESKTIKNPLPPPSQQQLLSSGRSAEVTKEKANMNLSDSSSSDDDDEIGSDGS